MSALTPLNLERWVAEHRGALKPPVANRVMFGAGEFIVMVVGGPNSRKDFHVDPGEELFYQLEGRMRLRVVEDGRIRDVPIGAGEMLVLPAELPHSPQREAGSVGLVVERRRRPGELDGLQWYCDACGQLLYQERFQLTDIETQFPPVFERFYGSLPMRTCSRCRTVMQPPAMPAPPDASQ